MTTSNGKVCFAHIRRPEISIEPDGFRPRWAAIGGVTAAYTQEEDGSLRVAFVRCRDKAQERRHADIYSIREEERRVSPVWDTRQGEHYDKKLGRDYALARLIEGVDVWNIVPGERETKYGAILKTVLANSTLSRAVQCVVRRKSK